MTDAMPVTRRLRRVAPLALVLVVAAACGDNDKGTATPQTSPGTTTASTATPPVPTGSPKASKKATLTMGTRNLVPLLQTRIRRFVPTQVEGHSVKVVALAGPTSFWAGRNRNQRILVTMRLKGGEPAEDHARAEGGLRRAPDERSRGRRRARRHEQRRQDAARESGRLRRCERRRREAVLGRVPTGCSGRGRAAGRRRDRRRGGARLRRWPKRRPSPVRRVRRGRRYLRHANRPSSASASSPLVSRPATG